MVEGSPGRALRLAEEEELELVALVDQTLAALPDPSPIAGHNIADKRGHQVRFVGLRPLDAWGDVWQALRRLQHETEWFGPDRRQAILSAFALLTEPVQVWQ